LLAGPSNVLTFIGSSAHGIFVLQAFYEDVFEEMNKHGRIECLNVCDNYSDHLVGNVYIKFADEQSALNAMTALQNRFYNGKPILAEFSPVADFREATCRQYEENSCQRGGYCNFMHLKPISRWAKSTPVCPLLMLLEVVPYVGGAFQVRCIC
jgi:Zinc finger C-x8-C-x5-C-x3-H type (and similar)